MEILKAIDRTRNMSNVAAGVHKVAKTGIKALRIWGLFWDIMFYFCVIGFVGNLFIVFVLGDQNFVASLIGSGLCAVFFGYIWIHGRMQSALWNAGKKVAGNVLK